MNYFHINEKALKRHLKNKKRITVSLIVSFLISGGLSFDETEARDLRPRGKQANNIKPIGGTTMGESANKTDVVNIVAPNSGGISHNKFQEFNVGTGNNVILNNSIENGVSQTGGFVTKNPNMTSSANAILNEVTGSNASYINGGVEVFGQRADLIIANENGITINGGNFINTSGVTLTTGSPTVVDDKIDLNVTKGNISIEGEGVGTTGDYFNIISQTIKLKGQIAPSQGEKDADITLIAGKNKVELNKGGLKNPKITETTTSRSDTEYGIYADKMGAMYGRNIKLISTTEGLGVRHEGIIRGSGDIDILSNGDIAVGGINAEKSVNIKGKGKLDTLQGSYKTGNVEYNYTITANNDINLIFEGDIEVNTAIQSQNGNMVIKARNLKLKEKSTAKILGQHDVKITLSGNLNVEAVLIPKISGRDPNSPPLVVLVDASGKLVVRDPVTGSEYYSNELIWESTGIFGKNIDISATNLTNSGIIGSNTNDRQSKINIKALNKLTNNKVISSSGDLNIEARSLTNNKTSVIKGAIGNVTATEIINDGEIRQNKGNLGETVDRSGKLTFNLGEGTFKNTGVVSGYNISITGNGFILNEKDGRIEASTEDYPRGQGKIVISARNLTNKGTIQSYGAGTRNDIEINTELLTNEFSAKIIAIKGGITVTTTVGDLLNAGEFFADENVIFVSAKDIKNSGKIGGDNISLKADAGELINYGKIAAVKELNVIVNDLINAGTPEEIQKYLIAYNQYLNENYENVLDIITKIENRLDNETDPNIINSLIEILPYYKKLEQTLASLKFEVDRVGAMGVMSGENITLTSNTGISNKGVISSKTDITATAKTDIKNDGILEANQNIILKTDGDITNTQRIYAGKNINITGNSFVSSGSQDKISEYELLLTQFDAKELSDAEAKIKELENLLLKTTDLVEIKRIKSELEIVRNKKNKLSEIKGKILSIAGLGLIESENIIITTTKKLETNGIVVAQNTLDLTAGGDIKNGGNILAGGNTSITGNSFENKNLGVKGDLNINVNQNLKSENITVDGKADISAQNFENTGELSIGKILNILLGKNGTPGAFKGSNTSKITVVDNFNLSGASYNNEGITTVGKDMTVDTNGQDFISSGAIKVDGKLDVKNANNVSNSSSITAGQTVNISATGDVSSKDMTVGSDILISGNSFENTGKLEGGGSLDIGLTNGGFTATNSSNINIVNNVNITGNSYQNNGTTTVGENVTVNSGTGAFNSNGALDITGNLKVNSNGIAITGNTNVGGKLDAIAGAGEFTNSGKLQVIENTNINSNGFNNTNEIIVGKELSVNAGAGRFNNHKLSSGGNTTVQAGNFTSSDSFVTGGNLNVDVNSGNFTNNGVLHSKDSMDITSKDFTNTGDIANSQLKVDAKGSINNTNSIQSTGNILLSTGGTTGNVTNSGSIAGKGSLVVDATKGNLLNSGSIKNEGKTTISVNEFSNKGTGEIVSGDLSVNMNKFINEKDASITGGKVNISGYNSTTAVDFTNDGAILSNGTLDIDLKGNTNKINLDGNNIRSFDKFTLKTAGDVETTRRFQNPGAIDIQTKGNFVNSGMVTSNDNISINANNITNNAGSTIWSAKDIVLTAINDLINGLKSVIESKGNMTLTATKIVNNAGSIKAGKDLNINADSLENKSVATGSGFKQVDVIKLSERYLYYNKTYKVYAKINIEFPVFESDLIVTDQATIQSGGNINIKGKNEGTNSNILNDSGIISASKNIDMKGNVINKTASSSMTVDEYLSKITVNFAKEVYTLLDSPLAGWNPNVYNGDLKGALERISAGKGDDSFYRVSLALAAEKNPQLKELLNTALGPNWTNGFTMDTYQGNSKYQVFATNGSARILSGGSFSQSGGKFENIGGEKAENQKVDISIGDNTTTADRGSLGVDVKDINSVTELGPVKTVNKVEVITGSVTINGITINAEMGNGTGAIAVAGTISPIIFIEVPTGENGIFKPAVPDPNKKIQPMFETNIDFIDPSKFYGSEYFLNQIGFDPNKTTAVIGDAYYETTLINNMIQQGLNYTGEVSTDQIKEMLDNALSVQNDLGLVLGQPLTPDQINNLEKDIVWYVEVEINGQVVLTPQVYFSKDTRLKLAENQAGNGSGSTVKAGGNVTIDATDVTNSNGNISSGGNVTIKSENNIVNSSTGGLGSGIISNGGNIDLDAKNDITNIGGKIVGEDISLKAGNDIKIESVVGYDKDGNQILSDIAGIVGNGNINLEAGNNVTIKGGSVESTGENSNVNISGENVNIEDINLVESKYKFEETESSITEESYVSSKSTGSSIAGSNINIDAKNDATIKGSDIVGTSEQGKVNIGAGNNVNIIDGQDLSSISKKTQSSTVVEGLVSISTSTTQGQSSKSKGSTVGGLGDLNITAGNDVTIKGSDIITGGNANIEAGNDLNILDGQDTQKVTSSESSYQVIGGSWSSSEAESTTSKGSSITSLGDINLKSGGNTKIVGGEIISVGDTNIEASGDVSIEAGKNTYTEKSESLAIGVTSASAGAGAAGAGASTEWDILNGGKSQVSSELNFGSGASDSKGQQSGTGGKLAMDSLANAQVTIGVKQQKTEIDSTTWTESGLTSGGNLNISAGKKVDIGGGDFSANGDVKIKGETVETTKYEDSYSEKSSGFDVGISISNKVTSNVADAVDKLGQAAENIKSGEANEALTAAQIAGTASNMIFGDLINNTVAVTAKVGVNSSEINQTKENTTSIKGNNVTIESTKGNINLAGVELEAKNDVTLDSAKDINITEAKSTSSEKSNNTSASIGVTQSSGVSAIDGAYATVGIAANASHSNVNNSSSTSTGSSISGNNITIKSKGDTNVIGSTVEAENNVDLNIGGNLNVETTTNSHNNKKTEGWAGVDVSVGVATNTVATGDLGVSAGGGSIQSSGDTIKKQAGITAKNSVNAKVDGDLNLKGANIGSETGNGELNVGGNINVTDVVAKETAGGEIIGVSGGTKGGGIEGTVGDIKDKQQTAKSTISIGTVNTSGDVTINGEKGDISDVNKDLDNSLITDKDVTKKGGSFSGTGSKVSTGSKKGSKNTETDSGEDGYDGGLHIPRPSIKKTDPDTTDQGEDGYDGGLYIPRPSIKKTDPDTTDQGEDGYDGGIYIPRPSIKKTDPDTTDQGEDGYDGGIYIPKPEMKPLPPDPTPVQPDSTSTPNNNGYKKNENGKWEQVTTGAPVILTGGAVRTKEAIEAIKTAAQDSAKKQESIKRQESIKQQESTKK